MMRIVTASMAVASTLALAPQMHTQKTLDRRTLGAGLVSAIGALTTTVPGAAHAEAGESPKFSFFGILGNADTFSEGAAYGIDQGAPVYSPYSPFTAREGDSVYKQGNAKEKDFKKKKFADSVKRVGGVSKYIEAKKWEEVRSELERQVYEMRNYMNYLAGDKPEAVAAAKAFYVEMEKVNYLSKKKDQAAAADAYTGMMAALDAYTKLI